MQIAEPSDLSVRRVRNGEVRRGTHAILEHTQPLLPIKPRWEIDCACKEAIGGRRTQDSVTRHSMKRFKCFSMLPDFRLNPYALQSTCGHCLGPRRAWNRSNAASS